MVAGRGRTVKQVHDCTVIRQRLYLTSQKFLWVLYIIPIFRFPKYINLIFYFPEYIIPIFIKPKYINRSPLYIRSLPAPVRTTPWGIQSAGPYYHLLRQIAQNAKNGPPRADLVSPWPIWPIATRIALRGR